MGLCRTRLFLEKADIQRSEPAGLSPDHTGVWPSSSRQPSEVWGVLGWQPGSATLWLCERGQIISSRAIKRGSWSPLARALFWETRGQQTWPRSGLENTSRSHSNISSSFIPSPDPVGTHCRQSRLPCPGLAAPRDLCLDVWFLLYV